MLVVSERGIGKRTAISEYPQKGRGGQGVLTFRVTPRSGPLAVARVLSAQHELILISRDGIVMRTRAEQISRQGRSTQGVSIMNVDDQDTVAAIAQIDLEAAAEPSAS
jgi:DNA gyrase subunit A